MSMQKKYNIPDHNSDDIPHEDDALENDDTSLKWKKRSWTAAEDAYLMKLVHKFGAQKWTSIAEHLPGRIGKQCRERWHNHLNPAIKKEEWSESEEWLLYLSHKALGNKWAEIARFLTGRTDNSIKNHWNSSMKKKIPELFEKYRRQKSLYNSKSSALRLSASEKNLFEKLELLPEEQILESEVKMRQFGKGERSTSPNQNKENINCEKLQLQKESLQSPERKKGDNLKTKKKRRRKFMAEILNTKSDILQSTPNMKSERQLRLSIPSGLSPPVFSALKFGVEEDKPEEGEREKPELGMIFKDIPQLYMSPFLNLSYPKKEEEEGEQGLQKISKKINFE